MEIEKCTVFLGGSCGDSKWREELVIPNLTCSYFNPVVPDWTEECYQRELMHRENDDYCLYVLSPMTAGLYSIAEVADDSNKRPAKTIFCFLQSEGGASYTPAEVKALDKVGVLVQKNGGKYFKTIEEVIDFLNASGNGSGLNALLNAANASSV